MQSKQVICSRGHEFTKTPATPVCPICWPGYKKNQRIDLPTDLSAPAYRALTDANITTLKKLAQYTAEDILSLHGIGPSSLPKLKRALAENNLAFKQ
ncbi:MAG TPA: DNA-directed RNA polymerase subunit alpha C-terminal domain-containing protein [Candidatus Paceibacterota bacterium]|nr:DNA-directed RNA polymerase subunit alpha C-terminal domain-containing protein [Candidatus Paceibacterota bacterium]